MANLEPYIDKSVAEDIYYFWTRVIEGFDYRAGVSKTFNNDDIAIQAETEYFGPNVTMDDRLRYMASNLSTNPNISDASRVLNFVITHFYGGRDCHRVLNAEMDPKKAYTDFERVLHDEDYNKFLRSNLDKAKAIGYSIWSKTELHTSLQSAANNYAVSQGRDKHAINMIHWLAGWITDGTVDRILNSKTLKECVEILCSKEGIGAYYGYHGGTDQSTNPKISFTHDEPFCIPGPGCMKTLKMLMPKVTNSIAPPGERVVWLRENQEKIFGKLHFDKYWHNIEVSGQKVYTFEQTELTTYTAEVALCQYGIYRDLLKMPEKISKRRIATHDVDKIIRHLHNGGTTSLESFMN
jgi:hypothetical protein